MPNWSLIKKNGKVREMYENADHTRVLLVAGDEMPEFERYLGVCVPGKGKLATKISKYWFEKTMDIVPNAYCSVKNEFYNLSLEDRVALNTDDMDNVIPMMKIKMLPVEVTVRGYVTAGMWEKRPKDPKRRYKGVSLPGALVNAAKLSSIIFAPTAKTLPKGERMEMDYNEFIDFFTRYGILNPADRAEVIRDYAMKLFDFATSELLHRGLILAETKFEFGINPATGNIVLGDELLTPDVTTYWDVTNYRSGVAQEIMVTQPIHDWIKAHPDLLVPNELLEDAALEYDKLTNKICR